MRLILEAIIFFITLGIVEAIIKPIATWWVKRRVLKLASVVLESLDKKMPELLKTHNGKQLEQIVRTKLEELTGESWSDGEIDEIFKLYDPRITADKIPG